MNLLSRLKVRIKLTLLLGLSALALVISVGAAASLMHARMVDDRIRQTAGRRPINDRHRAVARNSRCSTPTLPGAGALAAP